MKLLLTFALLATAAQSTPITSLGVHGAPRIADWQPLANPKKSYIYQLWTPGKNPVGVLEDSPQDHVHHHGMMFALGGDDTDFWTETGIPNSGTQQPVKTTPNKEGDGFVQSLCWMAADGTRLLEETRTVRVRATGSGDRKNAIHWLDWESTLTPAPGRDAVTLGGRHYFGLGIRLAPEWAEKAAFQWEQSQGQTVVRGDERLTPGQWCAATLKGARPVTVMMFSHPKNPRPGGWFTMGKPFAYLSATYDLEKNPHVLAKGTFWSVRHSVAVSTGNPPPNAIAREWQNSLPRLFLTPPPLKQP